MNELTSLKRDTRWEISMIRAENGWILEYWEETEDDERHKVERVFGDREEGGEKLSLIHALRELIEHFGQGGSKHDTKRIDIRYTEKWGEEE